MAARKGRRKTRGRKAPKRRTRKTTHISPMAHLARKVQGIDTRLANVEQVFPKKFVKRKRKPHRLGTLEERGRDYWGSGE